MHGLLDPRHEFHLMQCNTGIYAVRMHADLLVVPWRGMSRANLMHRSSSVGLGKACIDA